MPGHDFDRFIGIDYSGAQTPEARLKGLRVYSATPGQLPVEVACPKSETGPVRYWSRQDIAHWLLERLQTGERLLIGLDHGFSFPETYFRRYGLTSWLQFLDDFCRYWPTDQPYCYVDFIRDGNWWDRHPKLPGERTGETSWFRLCEQWTSSAKSVFLFDVQGSVAKSTHTGIPWLRFLRQQAGEKLFFWPFDGWQPTEGQSVIVEIYPSIFRNRYPREGRTVDQQDAYAVARWMEETVRKNALNHYLNPPLTLVERQTAALEGWILGIS